jgi:hypothetical protein
MNAARVAVQARTLGLGGVLAELTTARLRWCVVCGRVGLRGWQPLCAAMPITWVCADRAACRHRRTLQTFRREWAWRRIVVRRRPGLTRPPTGRPWRPAELAGSGGLLDGSQLRRHRLLAHAAMAVPEPAACAAEQAIEPTAEPPFRAHEESDVATPGRQDDRR